MHWHKHAAQEDLPDTPHHANLTAYLNGRKSLDQALDKFCGPVETKFMDTSRSEAVESLLLEAWNAVIAVAGVTPHDAENQQKLVDFVVRLAQRPTLSKGDKTCELHNGRVWRDMPVFSMQMRESWNLAATSQSDEGHQKAWVNLNAFTARLTAAGVSKKLQPLDLSLFCIWTVRDALEQQEAVADVTIEAAAVWFIHAAPALWSLCQQERSFDGKLAKPGPEFASREWRGFEKDRYQSWEHCFKRIKASLPDDKTAKLVDEAMTAMRTAE